jgi:D,D-heptose 1,7-bisphosphate phosphatase
MKKAIFLDRDGTIIKDKNYSFDPNSIEFIDGVISALQKLQSNGYLLIIITNQSGIARGKFTEKELNIFNDELLRVLKENNINIASIYYCPHHPHGNISQYVKACECRKPGTKLFLDAVAEYDIDLSQSYAIGDKERDCSICYFSECQGCLISESSDLNIKDTIKIFSTFEKCVDFIIGDKK